MKTTCVLRVPSWAVTATATTVRVASLPSAGSGRSTWWPSSLASASGTEMSTRAVSSAATAVTVTLSVSYVVVAT